jgi:uncharacterized protein YbjT (DUF2867 family)
MLVVIGGAGFIGAVLTSHLAAGREPVRILVRDEARARTRLGPAGDGVELVVGDMHDDRALDAALDGARAVFTTAQTVTSRQPAGAGDFATAERRATDRLLAAAERHAIGRVVAVGLIGARPDADSAWVRSRARIEQQLVAGPVEATVLRAGLVVGSGSVGFDGILAAARRPLAVILGSGRQHWSYIALADLVGYLVDAADSPAAAGRVLDVGSEEAPTYRELVARTAALLGRPAPRVVGVPLGAVHALAPLLERAKGTPAGGLAAAAEHLGDDLVGDTRPARALLPRELTGWEDAVRAALAGGSVRVVAPRE